jgi:hypothetical protein
MCEHSSRWQRSSTIVCGAFGASSDDFLKQLFYVTFIRHFFKSLFQ